MSSIMAQRVAINKLAQSYMAFNTNYHDTGLFGVYATADPKHNAVDDLVCLWTITVLCGRICCAGAHACSRALLQMGPLGLHSR